MYAVRKRLKVRGRGEGGPCACVWVHFCAGGRQFPLCLLRGACLFDGAHKRGNVDAGFPVIKLFTEPPGSFCLRGLEA